ncbi:MAG TPA: hypothetical protein VMW86_01150 [Dehalococcoidales bacterium]|nr:hypothetical protein [Dehalococcoidales bacterium]
MKKLVKKIWGVGLVVVLLASLLIAAIPVSAGNYSVTTDTSLPTYLNGLLSPLAPFSILDVAQSGDTIVAVGENGTGTNYIYRSTNAGATWARVVPVVGPAAGTWGLVALAPDDPNVICIVNTAPNPDVVYMSTNGGVTFAALTAPAAGAYINAIAISPLSAYRYVAIGGNTGDTATPAASSNASYLAYWTQGPLVPGWTVLAGYTGLLIDDVEALAYSPNFLADQALMIVTETVGGAVNGNVALRVYSYNTFTWDSNVDVTFPRMLESSAPAAVLTCARADIALDSAFFLGDETLQIGFIGAQITTPAATEAGGVYRVGTYTVASSVYTMTQAMSGVAVNSVAWDGTNVLAAQRIAPSAAQVVWRSANALSTVPVFQQNSTFKTPGTGSYTNVIFAGEAGYAFSQGNNSAIAKTTDLGKSFNGIALVNSNFDDILDFWISPDAAVTYVLADDGTDVNLWRKSAGVWQRVMILAGKTGEPWLVRADADKPDSVFLGKKGFKNMYYATDAGEHLWSVRSCSQNIQDFAVQDKDIVYVAAAVTQSVVKTSNGCFTWDPPVTTALNLSGGGNVYSIALLADNQLIVGGTLGGVTYSKDGNATWSGFLYAITSGQVLAAATGLETGDTIFAASSGAAAKVSSWKIGTNVAWTAGAAAAATGLTYNAGILYVYDNTANTTLRFLSPTIVVAVASDTIAMGATANYNQTEMINALQSTTGSTTLWARNGAGTADTTADVLDTYTEYFSTASNTPTPTYPINSAKIPVNSLSGAVNAFVFQWTSPAAVSTTVYYDYNVQVYLDAAGFIPVAGSATTAALGGVTPSGGLSLASGGLAGGAFAGVPGETYYWRVRVDAGAPLESYWSAMQTFTIQQMTAIVPVISSPENGKSVDSVSPAFSWSPISGATKYKFELSTNAAFVSTVYSTEVLTAGAMLPTTITLERGETYFWRVKALAPSEGDWSTVANFIVAELPAAPTPPVVIQQTPAPVINIPAPPPAQQIVIPAAPAEEVIAPAYIWAIIIIGAVLVIAVIVLIVRTRRSV